MSHAHLELGGICYLACDELFEFYNNSKTYCQKGCDFARGRVNDPVLRKEAEAMCKRLTTETLVTMPGELENIQDLRVSPLMVPYTPQNIYKACLSGIRRQKF